MSAASERSRVRRHPERGHYDHAEVHGVLDATFYGHLAFVQDGQPYAMPMLHVRDGERLYLHGSVKSRLIRAATRDIPLSYTVTIVDALVLARSAFNHSINYRSAVVIGRASAVREREEKLRAMDMLVDHIIPGRTSDARQANTKELKATEIIALSIEEASAKIRTGPPGDKTEDLEMGIWGGVLPVSLQAGRPQPDEHTPVEVPDYIRNWKTGGEAAS